MVPAKNTWSWRLCCHRARDQPFRLLELFPQNYHEAYYMSYTNEDFSALAISSGLTHIRDVKVFVSKVME